MKKLLLIIPCILLLSGCNNDKNLDDKNKPLYTTNIVENDLYQVLSVIDGDTIKVKIGNEKKTIRVLGIDTPEKKGGLREEECFGNEASEYTKNLLKNQKVTLKKSKTGNQKDKYGRLLRYIYFDNKDLGEDLIKNGYAESYKKFPHDKLNLYNGIEKEAKTLKKGMWDKSLCKN